MIDVGSRATSRLRSATTLLGRVNQLGQRNGADARFRNGPFIAVADRDSSLGASPTPEFENPAEGYPYDLHCDGTLHTKAGSFVRGATVSVSRASTSRLVNWLARDGAANS